MLARTLPALSDRQLARLCVAIALSLVLHVIAVKVLRSWTERSSIAHAMSSEGSGAPLIARLLAVPTTEVPTDPVNAALRPVTPAAVAVASKPQARAQVGQTRASSKGSQALDHRDDVKAETPELQHFYNPKETDLRARLLNPPDLSGLDEPALAYQGQTVRLRVFVDETGHAVKVDVVAPTDAPADLIEVLSKAMKTAMFAPADKDGKSVASYFLVDLSVTPKETIPPLIEKFSEPSK